MPKKTAHRRTAAFKAAGSRGGRTKRRRPGNTPMKDDLVNMLTELGYVVTKAIVGSWDAETRKVVRMYAHHKLRPGEPHSPVSANEPRLLGRPHPNDIPRRGYAS